MIKKSSILVFILTVFLSSCNSDSNEPLKVQPIKYKYGYDESKYSFEEKKVGRGDTFGDILEDQGIDYPEIYRALQKTKNDVDFRKLQLGKPYTLIYTNDSIPKLKAFVYQVMRDNTSFRANSRARLATQGFGYARDARRLRERAASK